MTTYATPVALAERLNALPRFYSHRDVLDQVFAGDEDALVDAWVSGALPPAVRQVVWEGGVHWLNTLLLARMCRQLNRLIEDTEAWNQQVVPPAPKE